VTGIAQVSDADIIVALSILHVERPEELFGLLFKFPDTAKREQFRDTVFRSYEDPKLFEPWKIGEYLSEPAGRYFQRNNNNGGGTPGFSLATVVSKRDNG
jgi:hypothetical protein